MKVLLRTFVCVAATIVLQSSARAQITIPTELPLPTGIPAIPSAIPSIQISTISPGDAIRTEIEVVGVRHSNSRPDYGVVRTRTLAYNQRDEVVLRSTVNLLAPLRSTGQK